MSTKTDILSSPQGPHKRNPDATRASILAAARLEFGERGLAGARVNQIADRAKVNKQLVYYYFNNKEGLYTAALEATYKDIRARERQLDLSILSPTDAMVRLIDFTLEYLNDHPEFMRMLAEENHQGARHVRKSTVALKTNSPILDLIADTLDRGVEEKVFRANVDPLELYVSIAGMTFFLLCQRPNSVSYFWS